MIFPPTASVSLIRFGYIFSLAHTLILLGTQGVQAATRTWDGDGNDTSWNTGTNWSGNKKPGVNDTAAFANTFGASAINLGANQSIAHLSISTATDFSLNGNILTLHDINRTAVTGTTTINSRIALGDNGTWQIEGNLAANGVVSESHTLIKSGSGTLILGNANTYTGSTTINGGTIRLGNASALGTTGAGTRVNSGAVLDLNGQAIGTEAVTLNGGALMNSSATAASLSGTVALTTTSSIGGSGNLTLSGLISGGGLIKVGDGTLTLNGSLSNTYSGMTTVNAGILVLSNTFQFNAAIPGALTIGDGVGIDTVVLGLEGQIGNSSAVTINSSGVLSFNGSGFRETIGTLTMTSGSINTGTGTLFVSGDVTSYAHESSATISGYLNLNASGNTNPSAARTFTIADGAAPRDMVVSAVIGDGSLIKAGVGTLELTGANTYTGTTSVNAGTLVVNGNQAGATGNVTVSGGARLAGTGTLGAATTTIANNGTLNAGLTFDHGSAAAGASNLVLNAGSIFEWDINAAGTTTSATTVVAGALTGTDAVFRILLNDFTGVFWNLDHEWTHIIDSGSGDSTLLSSLFTSFSGSAFTTPIPGLVVGQGTFDFTANTLRWTAAAGGDPATPEPTSALAGLLLAAGLLRRRR